MRKLAGKLSRILDGIADLNDSKFKKPPQLTMEQKAYRFHRRGYPVEPKKLSPRFQAVLESVDSREMQIRSASVCLSACQQYHCRTSAAGRKGTRLLYPRLRRSIPSLVKIETRFDELLETAHLLRCHLSLQNYDHLHVNSVAQGQRCLL